MKKPYAIDQFKEKSNQELQEILLLDDYTADAKEAAKFLLRERGVYAGPAPAPAACSRCGSNKVIPNCQIKDSGQSSLGKLFAVAAYKKPNALIFNQPILAQLIATLCCACGHVDISLADPAGVWKEFEYAPVQPTTT